MSAQPLAAPAPETLTAATFRHAPGRPVVAELVRFVVLALATGLGLSLVLTVGGLLFAAADAAQPAGYSAWRRMSAPVDDEGRVIVVP